MKKAILVTGGCGYIGSHVVRALKEKGYSAIVYDNLSTGFRESIAPDDVLIVGDVNDQEKLESVFHQHNIAFVMHFAASIVVPDSARAPLSYYHNNTMGTLNLLKVAKKFKVEHFVFSSTAAVYGDGGDHPVTETSTVAPGSPYGFSKLFSEQMIKDLSASTELSYVILRYFNVAGADTEGRNGQRTSNATHLIKVCCETALGERDAVSIYGDDYNTIDGTGVRDYVHVEDLASIHVAAVDYLLSGGKSTTLNCGYGKGYSVKEVINAFNDVLENPIKWIPSPRRPGDSAKVVAGTGKIKDYFHFTPEHDDLRKIVSTALLWESKMKGKEIKLKSHFLN